MSVFRFRPDLGVRRLLPAWRAMFRPQGLREDLIAALSVACVAVPLSLAIALASGVSPAIGLVTAVVSGIVCALFGGTPLAVSGPAAAMAVLVASIVERSGGGGLLVVVAICGALQLATGVLGLGRLIRLVPVSVVEGFTAGIGAIILIGQLPRGLGLPPPSESHVLDVLTHIGSLIDQAHPASVVLSLSTLALVIGLPRLHPRIPASLVAVAAATAAVAVFKIDVSTIGAIPSSLPAPSLPSLPTSGYGALISGGLAVYALASLETLLSSSAVDKLARGERHDPDQELIGQGLGNTVSALFGGLPCTGVIARSALNVQSGARTRRAALLHSIVLLGAVYGLSQVMAKIPVAALSGVLFAVAIRMLDPSRLRALWRVSRGDAAVYVTTFVAIVLIDLIEGVQWGLVAAFAIAAIRLGRGRSSHAKEHGQPRRLALTGPVTFLSSLGLERLGEQAAEAREGEGLVIDLSEVTSLDASGAEALCELVERLTRRGVRVALFGLRDDLTAQLARSEHGHAVEPLLVTGWREALERVTDGGAAGGAQRLLEGVSAYRRDTLPRYTALFEKLSGGQSPHTLFITCSDSRIQPSLITSTDPGELFLVRNVGNMVPPSTSKAAAGTGAAVEYAVGVLGVSEIVVCAHSRCGAIQAMRDPEHIPCELGVLRAWAAETEATKMVSELPRSLSHDAIGRLNALRQLEHLATYAVVAERVGEGKLRLHAWYFDVATGEIEAWSPQANAWLPLSPIEAHEEVRGEQASSPAMLGEPSPAE